MLPRNRDEARSVAEGIGMELIPMMLVSHAGWDAFLHQRIVWTFIFVALFVSIAAAGAFMRRCALPEDQ